MKTAIRESDRFGRVGSLTWFWLAVVLPLSSLSGAISQPVSAQTEGFEALSSRLDAIEKAVEARRKFLHVPGAALAIVRGDQVIYLNGLGYRDVKHAHPVTPDTQFAIGSSTKAFTALTVMQSVDDGKVRLKDSPKKYLPEFRLKDPEIDSKINVEDLLCHRSGLERIDLPWIGGGLNTQEVMRVVADAAPVAKLGEKFGYQNILFAVAGEVVASAQKKPWTRVVAQRILGPLEMRETNLSGAEFLRRSDRALGYNWDEASARHQELPFRDIPSVAPAGAINSSARDMTHWLRFLVNGGVYNGRRLITEQSFAEMARPRIKLGPGVDYGFGWFLRKWNDHLVVEHGGNIDGFNAQVAYMPDQKLGMVLLTNISASPLGAFAMNQVWQHLVGMPPAAAAPPAAAPTNPVNEVGVYQQPGGTLRIEIKHDAGKLTYHQSGAPVLTMISVGGRRYKLPPPAPDGIFLTFRPSAGKPDQSEVLVEQSAGSVILIREPAAGAAFQSPYSVEELHRRVIEALGGAENLKRHKVLRTVSRVDVPTQGMQGEDVTILGAPDLMAGDLRLRAAGKEVLHIKARFDGIRGYQETNVSGRAALSPTEVAELRLTNAIHGELNWSRLYKSVVVKGRSKVGDEETLEVHKTPEAGPTVRDHYSLKSFHLLKRDAGSTSETYRDYREVGGVMIPHTVQRSLGSVEGRFTVVEATWDVPVTEATFR